MLFEKKQTKKQNWESMEKILVLNKKVKNSKI